MKRRLFHKDGGSDMVEVPDRHSGVYDRPVPVNPIRPMTGGNEDLLTPVSITKRTYIWKEVIDEKGERFECFVEEGLEMNPTQDRPVLVLDFGEGPFMVWPGQPNYNRLRIEYLLEVKRRQRGLSTRPHPNCRCVLAGEE